MKKTMLFLTLAMAATVASAQNTWSVTGKIKGLNDGDTIQLNEVSHIQKKPLAEAIVSKGTFKFEGQLDSPRGVYLMKKNTYASVPLILFNEAMTVSGSFSEKQEGENTIGTFDAKVKGSTLTDQFKKKNSPREDLNKLYAETHDPFNDFFERMNDADAKGDTVLLKQLQESDEYKRMADEEARFFNTVEETYTQMFKENADTWWGPFLMVHNLSYFTEKDTTFYTMLSPEAQQSYYGKMMREEIYPDDNKGKEMPLFTVTESEKGNAPLALADVLKANKYVLVDFWASWCGPCRKEIPNLKKVYEAFHSKGFEIFSVSLDKKADQWLKACEEEQLPWISYRDTEGVDALYKVRFIPAMFILDSKGRLVAQDLRGEALANKLAELLP